MQRTFMTTNKLILFCLGITTMLIIMSACGKDDPDKIFEKDKEKIAKYLKENDIDAVEHESGIFYLITREGSGAHPTINSVVNISYKGYFLDGKVFDSGNYYNTLRSAVRGWQIGIPLFKRGGEGMLFIPSGLGYGEWPRGNIPGNSILIFEIELIDFSN